MENTSVMQNRLEVFSKQLDAIHLNSRENINTVMSASLIVDNLQSKISLVIKNVIKFIQTFTAKSSNEPENAKEQDKIAALV